MEDLDNMLKNIIEEKKNNITTAKNTLSATSIDEYDNLSNQQITVKDNTVYHIIFDVDFPDRENMNFQQRRVKGEFQKTIKDRIPLATTLDDAYKISNHLYYDTVKSGTTNNKSFPIFGMIILEYKLPELSVKDFGKIDDLGKRNYEMITSNSSKEDIFLYSILKKDGNFIKRALITEDSLSKSKLISARFGYISSTPKQIGFIFFNNMAKFSTDDIVILNKMFEESDNKEYKYIFDGKSNEIKSEMSGGFDYRAEKTKYLYNKKLAQKYNLI
jgi:hypothetical protein